MIPGRNVRKRPAWSSRVVSARSIISLENGRSSKSKHILCESSGRHQGLTLLILCGRGFDSSRQVQGVGPGSVESTANFRGSRTTGGTVGPSRCVETVERFGRLQRPKNHPVAPACRLSMYWITALARPSLSRAARGSSYEQDLQRGGPLPLGCRV
jgi:hypothetical protein